MLKLFCDRCEAPVTNNALVSVTETILAQPGKGKTSIKAWVAFGGRNENGNPYGIDLCPSCISLFCAALANRARAAEKGANEGQERDKEPQNGEN